MATRWENEDDNNDLSEKVNNLTLELQVAKESIKDLQEKLDLRESELRKSKEKQERSFRRSSRQRKFSGLLSPRIRDEVNSDVCKFSILLYE